MKTALGSAAVVLAVVAAVAVSAAIIGVLLMLGLGIIANATGNPAWGLGFWTCFMLGFILSGLSGLLSSASS